MKRGVLVGLIVLGLFFVNFVSAKDLFSTSGVQYEEGILNEFNKLEGTEKFIDLIVYLKNISNADALISSFSSDEIGRVVNRHLSNMISIEMTEEAFLKLIQDDRIESVYYNAPVDLTLEESASLINADNVWSSGYNGSGVKVCIIDSGIDTDQIDLEDRIVAQKCYCSDNCCPDNTNEDDSAEDEFGHGTKVINVIVSNDGNYTGVAPDTEIYVVKVAEVKKC